MIKVFGMNAAVTGNKKAMVGVVCGAAILLSLVIGMLLTITKRHVNDRAGFSFRAPLGYVISSTGSENQPPAMQIRSRNVPLGGNRNVTLVSYPFDPLSGGYVSRYEVAGAEAKLLSTTCGEAFDSGCRFTFLLNNSSESLAPRFVTVQGSDWEIIKDVVGTLKGL